MDDGCRFQSLILQGVCKQQTVEASRCWALPARHGSFESFGCCDWCECRRRRGGDWLWLWQLKYFFINNPEPWGRVTFWLLFFQLVFKLPTSTRCFSSSNFFRFWFFHIETLLGPKWHEFIHHCFVGFSEPAGDHGQRHWANSIRNPRAVAASEPLDLGMVGSAGSTPLGAFRAPGWRR